MEVKLLQSINNMARNTIVQHTKTMMKNTPVIIVFLSITELKKETSYYVMTELDMSFLPQVTLELDQSTLMISINLHNWEADKIIIHLQRKTPEEKEKNQNVQNVILPSMMKVVENVFILDTQKPNIYVKAVGKASIIKIFV